MSASVDAVPLDRRTRVDRMRARSWALQVLYAWEARGQGESLVDAMHAVLASRRVAERRVPLVERHVRALAGHFDEIDSMIREAADNWRLERLTRVDRCILRLGVAELLFVEDVPPKVAIQEAIRLAGQYGGDQSPRFVNGVLDAIYKAHPDGEARRESPRT